VILTKDDLAMLPVSKSPEIAILEFVPIDQVDPIYFDKPYYLEPSSKSPKAYVLLAKALETTERLAIANFTLRNKTRLAALRVIDGVMTLQTLLWPDEVRVPDFDFLSADVEIRDQELDMAASLIETMASDFDPSQFEDTYQIELNKLIEARAGGDEAFPETDEAPEDDDSEVADLLAALRASVKGRGRDVPEVDSDASETDDEESAPKRAAKKTAAKKTAAKKAPAKKAAAKKDAPRRAAG